MRSRLLPLPKGRCDEGDRGDHLRLYRQHLLGHAPVIHYLQQATPVLYTIFSVTSHTSLQREAVIHSVYEMPLPGSSQKGTGKKGGAGAIRQQPRSRNTTPSSALPLTANLPPIEVQETETLELKFDVFRDLTYEDLVDPGASSALIPDSKALDGIKARLERLAKIIDDRNSYCDRGMRLLAQSKRDRRMNEMAEEGRREDERIQREADEERERKANKKKRKATESLAPQSSNAGQFIQLHLPFRAHLALSRVSNPPPIRTYLSVHLPQSPPQYRPQVQRQLSFANTQPRLA